MVAVFCFLGEVGCILNWCRMREKCKVEYRVFAVDWLQSRAEVLIQVRLYKIARIPESRVETRWCGRCY